jgi:hypothetical protein
MIELKASVIESAEWVGFGFLCILSGLFSSKDPGYRAKATV